MAYYVGIFENAPYEFSKEIESEVFYGYIPQDVVPEKCFTVGVCTFFYDSGEMNMPIEEANDFFIYNSTQGLLYKFLVNWFWVNFSLAFLSKVCLIW